MQNWVQLALISCYCAGGVLNVFLLPFYTFQWKGHKKWSTVEYPKDYYNWLLMHPFYHKWNRKLKYPFYCSHSNLQTNQLIMDSVFENVSVMIVESVFVAMWLRRLLTRQSCDLTGRSTDNIFNPTLSRFLIWWLANLFKSSHYYLHDYTCLLCW